MGVHGGTVNVCHISMVTFLNRMIREAICTGNLEHAFASVIITQYSYPIMASYCTRYLAGILQLLRKTTDEKKNIM